MNGERIPISHVLKLLDMQEYIRRYNVGRNAINVECYNGYTNMLVYMFT